MTMVEQDWQKANRERRMTGEITLDVEPDVGMKGNVIEYMYHYTYDGSRERGEDLNATDASEWREVKKDIVACREAAEKGELHNDIVEIEKVWHDVIKEHHWDSQGYSTFQEESWVGYTTLWQWSDYGGTGAPCGVEDCDTFVEDGQGSRIWEWDGCCDDCNEQYKNGEWTPDVEQERGR